MSAGFLALDFFFVLSGFIIAYNYADRLKQPTWRAYKKYVYMRFARVYPVHAVTLLFFGLGFIAAARFGVEVNNKPDGGAFGLFLNVVMLQGIPGGQFAWNIVSWTLTYEWLAYLAFPLLAMLLARINTVRGFVVMSVVAMTVTGVGLTVMALTGVDLEESHAPGLFRIIGGFVSGVALYGLYRMRAGVKRRWDLITGVCLVAMVAAIYACVAADLSVSLVLPVVVLAVYGMAQARGPVKKFLAHRITVYFGVTTYSLYMAHVPVFVVMRKIFPSEEFDTAGIGIRIGIVLSFLVVAQLVGMVLYHAVEQPSRNWLRRRYRRPKDSVRATD